MFRSVGPLLLGLGLCVASGCTLVGGGRSLNLVERFRNRASQKAVDEEDTTAIVSLRPSQRDREAPTSVTDDADFTGHSPRFLHEINNTSSSVLTAGRNVEHGVTERAVIDAQFRSDRDSLDNPVELQGLQVIDPATTASVATADAILSPDHAFVMAGVDPSASVATMDTILSPRKDAWPSVESGTNAVGDTPQNATRNTSGTSGPWQVELDQLIARVERELATSSPGNDSVGQAEYRRRQVHLRLLHLVARHPEQALTVIPSLEPADQEYWQQILLALTNSLDVDGRSARDRAAQSIPPVNMALRRLREQADLIIRNPAFCEEISYFGNYKRFPRDEFVPGQPVLLYAEIENFRSEPTPTGEYRTLLRSLIEIVGANGQIRWKKNFAATEDVCRNPRRDYFHNYQFTIPERLPLGPHTLRLTVVDELSSKQSTCSLKFVVK